MQASAVLLVVWMTVVQLQLSVCATAVTTERTQSRSHSKRPGGFLSITSTRLEDGRKGANTATQTPRANMLKQPTAVLTATRFVPQDGALKPSGAQTLTATAELERPVGVSTATLSPLAEEGGMTTSHPPRTGLPNRQSDVETLTATLLLEDPDGFLTSTLSPPVEEVAVRATRSQTRKPVVNRQGGFLTATQSPPREDASRLSGDATFTASHGTGLPHPGVRSTTITHRLKRELSPTATPLLSPFDSLNSSSKALTVTVAAGLSAACATFLLLVGLLILTIRQRVPARSTICLNEKSYWIDASEPFQLQSTLIVPLTQCEEAGI